MVCHAIGEGECQSIFQCSATDLASAKRATILAIAYLVLEVFFLILSCTGTCIGSMLVVAAWWLIKAAVCRRPLRCLRRGSC